MKNITPRLLLGLCLVTLSALADSQRFTVLGRGVIFALAEPSGWKIDSESGKKDGAPVVYYPRGGSWEASSVVMYANSAIKKCQPSPALRSFIESEVREFKQRSPGVKISDVGSLDADGRKVILRKYEGDRFGNHELVAYIEEKTAIVSITISAKSAQEFKDSYPAFKELVTSYQHALDTDACHK